PPPRRVPVDPGAPRAVRQHPPRSAHRLALRLGRLTAAPPRSRHWSHGTSRDGCVRIREARLLRPRDVRCPGASRSMTRVRGVRRRRTAGPLRLAIVSVALAACGSLVKMEPAAADGPRISGLEIATARPVAGCPVRFRLHLDAGADDRM